MIVSVGLNKNKERPFKCMKIAYKQHTITISTESKIYKYLYIPIDHISYQPINTKNSTDESWTNSLHTCLYIAERRLLKKINIFGYYSTVLWRYSYESCLNSFREIYATKILGGALYIMFENHVRSWPLLKTPWYTRGYMSRYLCIQMYSILNICLM